MNFLSILMLIFSPLIAALIILSPIFPSNKIKIRRFSKTFAILHFIYSLLFLMFFNSTNMDWAYQKELTFFGSSWLKSLGISATFGADGVSLIFILLTSFITMLVLISSKPMIRINHRLFYPLALCLQSTVLGTFCTKDMLLFYLFWQSELIISYLLVFKWTETKSKQIGSKYLIYDAIGNFSLLLGILILYFYSFAQTGILSADIESLSISDGFFAISFNSFIFWCFFIGFATKMAVFPLHNGIIEAQTKTSAPVNMLLNGLVMNMGFYGFIRFNMDVFSEYFGYLAHILIILGIINIVYGVCLALSQKDIKKIVCYSNMVKTGFILLGLSALNDIGFDGALYHIICASIVFSGLFLLVGSIYLRTKTYEINILGGLRHILPVCYNLGLIICLGAIGVPFTGGFISKFMIINGLMLNDELPELLFILSLLLSILVILLNARNIIFLFQKTFYGEIMPKFNNLKAKRVITKSEIIVLTMIALSIIFLGCFPSLILDAFEATSDVIIDFLRV